VNKVSAYRGLAYSRRWKRTLIIMK
jgi:hypothetical protein